MRPIGRSAIVMGLALLLGDPTAKAQDNDTPQLHGFGGWGFGDTDGNAYLLGAADGSYDNTDAGLNLAVDASDRLRIVTQLNFKPAGREVETVLDFAFAEWYVADSLNVRVGRAKHPFGIYGETFRIGTARPFFDLPQGVYGPSGNVGETYDGVALRGTFYTESGWELAYDAYGGKIDIRIRRPWLLLRNPNALNENELRRIDDVFGGRLIVRPPVSGLSVGFSIYKGNQESGAGGGIPSGRHLVYGGEGAYESERWLLRRGGTPRPPDGPHAGQRVRRGRSPPGRTLAAGGAIRLGRGVRRWFRRERGAFALGASRLGVCSGLLARP